MLPAVPPLNRATIDRCWLAIRMNWQPARVGASEHACRSTDLLGFLNQRGENIPNDMSDLGKVTWRPLQRLIEKHFHIQQPGGFIYAHRKAPLAVEEGGVDFYEACAQGEEKDVDDVRSLLSSPIGADAVNTPSAGKGEYPLAIAAQNGKIEVAFELLQRTPVLIAADTAGNTALHYAASGGHLRLAEMLIDAGASIDNENAYGETPLHFACRSSRPEVANLLLDKGAEVSAEFKQDYVKRASRAGFTALHYSAAAPEMGQITTLLLVEGQYAYRAFDVRTNFGQTPLERAAKANRHDSVMAISKWPGPEDPNAKKKKPGTSPGKKRR
jgi:ankyrin repeat protein